MGDENEKSVYGDIPSFENKIIRTDEAILNFKEMKLSMRRAIKTCTLVALHEELTAMRAMLDKEIIHIPRNKDIKGPILYYTGTIVCSKTSTNSPDRIHKIVIAITPKQGNNAAAITATYILNEFPAVSDILMVGIAAGVPAPSEPQKHVRLGDIVVSKDHGVIQYDMIKLEPDGPTIRDTSKPPSSRLMEIVDFLASEQSFGRYHWEPHITRASRVNGFKRPDAKTDLLFDVNDPERLVEHPEDPRRDPGIPRVHYGLIGSANILLKDAKVREKLGNLGIKAIEMEGSGIADAAWIGRCEYLVVRGISDYADSKKNDTWREYAALVAACYTRALLEQLGR